MSDLKIPNFLARMKELTEDLGEFYLQREKCSARLKDAARYFKREITEKERIEALELLNKLLSETHALDMKIRAAQTEYATLLEAKATGYVARFNLPEKIDAAGDKQAGVEVVVDPWIGLEENDNQIVIRPEELWIVRMVQKLFGTDATDLRKTEPSNVNSSQT